MGYTFIINLVYTNLNSSCEILNDVILTFCQLKHLTLEIESCDCLKIFIFMILAIFVSFVYEHISYKKTV